MKKWIFVVAVLLFALPIFTMLCELMNTSSTVAVFIGAVGIVGLIWLVIEAGVVIVKWVQEKLKTGENNEK